MFWSTLVAERTRALKLINLTGLEIGSVSRCLRWSLAFSQIKWVKSQGSLFVCCLHGYCCPSCLASSIQIYSHSLGLDFRQLF